jgi:hypothetical protein
MPSSVYNRNLALRKLLLLSKSIPLLKQKSKEMETPRKSELRNSFLEI